MATIKDSIATIANGKLASGLLKPGGAKPSKGLDPNRSDGEDGLVGNSADFSIQAVTGTFTPGAGGVLSVFGDGLDNNVAVSRNAAGNILVNGGAVPVLGGTPTVANTSLIQVFGQVATTPSR